MIKDLTLQLGILYDGGEDAVAGGDLRLAYPWHAGDGSNRIAG